MNSNKLSDAAKTARRNYLKEWRAKNPDKVKAQMAKYWERQALKLNDGETITEKAYRLHNDGFSLREIAVKTGINHVAVSRLLKSKQS